MLVQHHSQLCESTTPEINELTAHHQSQSYSVYFREAVSYLLYRRGSTAMSAVFPLLLNLILSFERALLSPDQYWTGMCSYSVQCTVQPPSSPLLLHFRYTGTSENISLDTEDQSLELFT